jgi:hypothetical protein
MLDGDLELDDVGDYDLGSGTRASWSTTKEGDVVGLVEFHTCNGSVNGGAVMLETGYGPTSLWHVDAGEAGVWEGLTLSPSIACGECGHHGWIRDGKWVPA